MKKLIFSSVVALAFLASCNGNSDKTKSDSANDTANKAAAPAPAPANGQVAAAYQCPMKCEGEKTYAEPGKCPACQMDLKEVK